MIFIFFLINDNCTLGLIPQFPGSLNLSFHNLSIYQFSWKNTRLAQFIPRIYNKIIIKILGYFRGITQPMEYSWMSGNSTPPTKIGQSLLCTGSSVPNNLQQPHRVHMRVKWPLRPMHQYSQIISQPTILHGSRVNKSLLIQTYIKIYNFNTCYTKINTKATIRLSSKTRPLVSVVLLYTPYT